MKRKPVYICHPFKGQGRPGEYEANFKHVEMVCQTIAREMPDILPVSPIHSMGFLDESKRPEDRQLGLECDIDLMLMVGDAGGELWAFGDYENSKGCMAEIKLAQEKGMPVKLLGWKIWL